jgi:hypothetical protein
MKHLMRRAWAKYALVAVVTAMVIAPTAAIAGHNFSDVPSTHTFHGDIEWMLDNGITSGCGPAIYCPDSNVTRGQMAAFMKRLATKKVVDAKTALTAISATTATNAANSDKVDGLDSTYFLPAEVPLGATIRGTIGGQTQVAGANEASANAQLPIPAPVGLTDAVVTVAGGVDDTDGACTGTSAAPTADPGYVCIYPYSTTNAPATQHRGYIWGGGDGTKWGFQISWVTSGAGNTYFYANWAYTAPLTLAGVSGASSSGDPIGVGGN